MHWQNGQSNSRLIVKDEFLYSKNAGTEFVPAFFVCINGYHERISIPLIVSIIQICSCHACQVE